MKDDKRIHPARVNKHVGEITPTKQHELYVTLLTELVDPKSLKAVAVARTRDTAAAPPCPGN